MTYHTHIAGQKSQHTREELEYLHQQGKIGSGDLYWTKGMPSWAPIRQLFGGTTSTGPKDPIPRNWHSPETLTHRLAKWLRIYGWTSASSILLILLLIPLFIVFGSKDPSQMGGLMLGFILLGALSSFAILGAYLVCAVNFCQWTYLIVQNAEAKGNPNLPGSATLAAWSYFIPIASLFLPYLFLRKVYEGRKQQGRYQTEEFPSIITTWWITAVLSSIQLYIVVDLLFAGVSLLTGQENALIPTILQGCFALISTICSIAKGFLGAKAVEIIGESQISHP